MTRYYALYRKVNNRWVRITNDSGIVFPSYPKPVAIRLYQNLMIAWSISGISFELRPECN